VLSSIKKLIEGFMTSRERVIRAMEFTNPDRVPLSHGILPAAWYAYRESLRKIVEKYPGDLYKHNPTSPEWHPWDSFLNKMSWNVEDDFAGVGPGRLVKKSLIFLMNFCSFSDKYFTKSLFMV